MKTQLGKKAKDFMKKIHNNVTVLNGSKIFAGIMIIVLQISSRFVTIRLSKTMESYLKYTFSKQILIFAIAWMGTRDIYIALIIAIVFSFIADVLCNEESQYCMLPNTFKDYHIQLAEEKEDENNDITKNIPGMPPTNNASSTTSKREGLTTRKSSCDKSKVVTEDQIEQALEVLDNAKQQYTWKSLDEPFFK
tara:strand:- start:2082 stop:2660 length:579 start_codon:yes stop_codon:yes gene_type:complete